MSESKKPKGLMSLHERIMTGAPSSFLTNPEQVVLRSGKQLIPAILIHNREELIADKSKRDMIFEDYKLGRIKKKRGDFNIKLNEKTMPEPLDEVFDKITSDWGIRKIRPRKKRKKRRLMRMKQKISGMAKGTKSRITHNNSSILDTKHRNSTISNTMSEASGYGGMIRGNKLGVLSQTAGSLALNSLNKNGSFLTRVAGESDSRSRVLRFGNSESRTSMGQSKEYLSRTVNNLDSRRKYSLTIFFFRKDSEPPSEFLSS